MKKTLSLILAVMMLLGCMTVTVFAKGDPGDGNTTDITATVPDITYNVVIPASTELTENNHTGVLLGGTNGKATVEITGHPSSKVNIYYTVDLAAGNLSDGNGHTIDATYTYAQGGDYAALTGETKVTVYTGGNVVDSTVKVTADDTQWKNAPSGNYTASITFNFVKEEAEQVDWLYLDTNSIWNVESSAFYVYTWGQEAASVLEMLPTDATNVFKVDMSKVEGTLIIVRVDDGTTFDGNDWYVVTNQTGDLSKPEKSGSTYKITALSQTKVATGEWVATPPQELPEWEIEFEDRELEFHVSSSADVSETFTAATVTGATAETVITYTAYDESLDRPSENFGINPNTANTLTCKANAPLGFYIVLVKVTVAADETHNETTKVATFAVTVDWPPVAFVTNVDGSASSWIHGDDNYGIRYRNGLSYGLPDVTPEISEGGKTITFGDVCITGDGDSHYRFDRFEYDSNSKTVTMYGHYDED